MKNETKKAIIIATEKEIEVYKLRKGGWCDAKNCTTEYKDSELKILNL